MPRPILDRGFAALIALIAWSALILEYVLLVDSIRGDLGLALATLRFLGFFTILSNLLVALVTTGAASAAQFPFARFLARPRVRGAAALCIVITCAIYFFVLASTWSPQGLRRLADVAMHYVVPGLYLPWWLRCVPHRRLAWGDALRWLLVPLAYLAWTLLDSTWLHRYPYPFIDVDVLGVAVVARNCIGIGALFLLFGLVLIALDRCIGGSRESGAI